MNALLIALVVINLFILVFYVNGKIWKAFDPTWLVHLAQEQKPKDIWLHEALKKCTKISGGCYFVNPKRPNKPNSEWQFKQTIILEHLKFGDILLDVLQDGRVGGIEYLGLKLQEKKDKKSNLTR